VARSHGRSSPSTQILRLGGLAGTDRGRVRDGLSGPEDSMGGRLRYAFGPGKRGTPSPDATNAASRALKHWNVGQRPREALMKRVIRRVAEVVTISAGLYRELALSALALVPGRR
jgi:hypothetical protein